MAAAFIPRRIINRGRQCYPAAPEQVFPLLCPVREYDWLEGWKCRVIWSDSGVAEENCIFSTEFADVGGAEIWTVSRYRPPREIEFVRFGRQELLIHLSIRLTPGADESTCADWTRVCTGLTPEGNALLANLTDAVYEGEMRMLERTLTHYLTTGRMLTGLTGDYRRHRHDHADHQ